MNPYRKMLVRALIANGGYSRGYHDRWAIEYPVALYHANLDIDHIYKVMCDEIGYLPPPTGSIEWDQNDIWSWCQENMARGLVDGDNYGYSTYGPDTAKRFGLPYHRFPNRYARCGDECVYYPAKKPGWRLVDPFECIEFDVKFGLAGRGGKHLVVEEFEGRRLDVSSTDLAEQILNDESGAFPNVWCQHLLAMMAEWEQCFTSRVASKELEYQAASHLYSELNERTDAWRERLAEARETQRLQRLSAVLARPLTRFDTSESRA